MFKIDKEKLDGNYHLTFELGEISEAEKADFDEAIAKNGKLEVDFGGTFTEEVLNEDTSSMETIELFKFNQNLRELPDNLPYSRVFKKSQYGENAEKFANLYAETMKTKIEAELEKLKDSVDNFSNSDIIIHY